MFEFRLQDDVNDVGHEIKDPKNPQQEIDEDDTLSEEDEDEDDDDEDDDFNEDDD